MKPIAVTCCWIKITEEASSLGMGLDTDVAGGVGELDCRRYEAVAVSQSTLRKCSCLSIKTK